MAFPFLFEANFEGGTVGEFDSETDTASILDAVHYAELARIGAGVAPWRGAYCGRVVLAGGTTDAYLEEGGIDIADDATRWLSTYWWFSPDLVMANNDTFEIMQLRSAAADEGVVAVRYTTAAGFEIGVGETAGESWADLQLGKWVHVEMSQLNDAEGSGATTLYLDGASVASVTGDTHAAVTHGRIGAVGPDAGTSGTILFDSLVFDDAQVYPRATRFPRQMLMTKSGHAFVGQGSIENVTLISGNGTDCVLEIYDTDSADTNDAEGIGLRLGNTAANEVVDPAGVPVVPMIHGCYVSISGTNPRALVTIKSAAGWGSDGAILNVGRSR